MEARKITVVSTRTQKKSVVMSGAETLADLKRDLRNAGIDYNDMTFYEGLSKTEFKSDDSVLPTNVPYTNRTTGETRNTNELVIMLTNPNKKIRSGATTRAQVYSKIKEYGLQGACLTKYGRNFTQCSTADLIALISKCMPPKAPVVSDQPDPSEALPDTPESPKPLAQGIDFQARKAIMTLVDMLHDYGTFDDYDADTVKGALGTLSSSSLVPVDNVNTPSPYSDSEIDAMLSGML